MTDLNTHNTDSVDHVGERRGRIPCWLSDFGKVIGAVAAGPRSRTSRTS